ncbi:MAG TPA: hypothetical protein PLG55_11990, partial [Methanospirillum sp.]|uniref:hypothetical protein n=2 Tax=Methanospirillum sp. TaxID=45200 RepID=UPI002BE9F745
DEIGMNAISTKSVCHLGLAWTNEEEIGLTPEEQCIAKERRLVLADKYKNRISAAAGPLSLGRGVQEKEKARLEGRTMTGRGYLTGCGCMWSKMAVRPDGMLAHIELGRINEVPLMDVWRNHPEFNLLRERYKIPLSDFDESRDCEYQMMCTGNCPASGYTRTGNVYAPSPDGCLKSFWKKGER